MENAIGKVTATENKPTTCNIVRFWVQQDVIIRPFDIIRITHIPREKSSQGSYTYAIIQDLQYITDSAGHLANYVSSDFGDIDSQPQNERLGTTIAEAEVLYNNEEIEMPVHDGATVEWADIDGIKDALGLRAFKQPVPAGYIRISNGTEIPIEFEASYLLGPEGAHLNITGISGLATKTSYAIFLMNSIQQKMGERIKTIIFNVKGTDLLRIDEKPEAPLSDAQVKEWEKCRLEAVPFNNVTFFYPYSAKSNNFTISHANHDVLSKQYSDGRAFNYFYDIETAKNKLALLFSDIDDPNATMESIVHQLLDIEVDSWKDLKELIVPKAQKGTDQSGDISKLSWRKFKRLLETRIDHALFTERSTTEKDKRKQKLLREAIRDMKGGDVLVIDIEPLPDYLQCFVFGDVIQTIYGAKQGSEEDIEPDKMGTFVIFADELNKYAPKGSESGRTLTQNLLEITERGRSLGVILFGAEQFRSGVHDRILGNCSTNVYGRTSPVEIEKCPDYKYFPSAYKSSLTRLTQGDLLLQHAVFRTALIKVRFPYPAYFQPKGG